MPLRPRPIYMFFSPTFHQHACLNWLDILNGPKELMWEWMECEHVCVCVRAWLMMDWRSCPECLGPIFANEWMEIPASDAMMCTAESVNVSVSCFFYNSWYLTTEIKLTGLDVGINILFWVRQNSPEIISYTFYRAATERSHELISQQMKEEIIIMSQCDDDDDEEEQEEAQLQCQFCQSCYWTWLGELIFPLNYYVA